MGSDRNSYSFKVLWLSLLNDEDPFKNGSTRVLTTFLPKSKEINFRRAADSVDPGQILLNLEPSKLL